MARPSDTHRISEDDNEGGGAGSYALAGYEYQIDVSVWLALDLVLANKLTGEIVLEPASQEDVEAELAEHEPGRVIGKVGLDGYRLLVQAKLRNGNAWTEKGLVKLLTHGGNTRKSAAEYLSDPQVRYLLVTSAALNGGTRQLAVRRAGTWQPASRTPPSIAKVLPAGAAGRVAVIGGKIEEHLATEIQRLLSERFRVPHARWQQCWQALREAARMRIRGGGGGRWTRAELEQVIAEHEGYLASSPELDRYVYPTQWDELIAAMADRHAALIVGQSGTGKTMATRKLYEVLREQIPGLAHVHITHGPPQLVNDQTAPPVLYDIEDPWGRFDFDRESRPWNDQLAGLLARASADRLIVATSRLDVAHASGALRSVEPWVVRLEAEHYGHRERRALFQGRIAALPRELQPIAMRAEKTVLANLSTPLEIQKFFDALPTLDRAGAKYERKFVATAIQQAHQESIERTVIEQIGEREDIPAAAVLWALLKANGKISLRGIRTLENELAEHDSQLADKLMPLIDFFVAARNLRQSDDVVTYYHPRVESGIEQALLPHAASVRRTLRALIDALVATEDAWGAGVAARLIEGASRLDKLRPTPKPVAQTRIDAWLEARLAEPGAEFEAHLQLAAAAGSDASSPAELARYLLHRPEQSFWGLTFWRAPDRDEAWHARMRASTATVPLLDRFIRQVLPQSRIHYPADFARHLDALAPGLTEAFLAAAKEIVAYGVVSSDDAIAGGALEDLAAFESIVDAAVGVLTPSDKERAKAQEQRLAIINGEYSEDYVEHLANDDDGHTAGEFLKAYVDQVRSSGDWQRLAQHRHRDHLLFRWLRDLEEEGSDTPLDIDELAALFAAVQGQENEALFWRLLLQRWQPAYLPVLLDRVRDRHPESDVRQAALACLVAHAPAELACLTQPSSTGQHVPHSMMIALDLGALRRRGAWHDRDEKRHAQEIEAAVGALPPALAQIARASVALGEDQAPTLDKEALDLLARIGDREAPLRRFRIDVDRYFGLPVDDDIRWLLAHAKDDTDAAAAVDAAARRGLAPEVRTALNHRFSRASARALAALAAPLPTPLPTFLLDKADAKGSPVRKALVAALDAKPHPDHLPTLLKLARDTWSSRDTYHIDDGHYPIARAATDAIAKLDMLTPAVAEELHEIALGTSDRTVRSDLFIINAQLADDAARRRLLDLVIAPGRTEIQRAAANALLQSHEHVSVTLAQYITAELLTVRAAPVAAKLALLLSLRGEPHRVLEAARGLAPNPGRRALLLLLAWPLAERDEETARHIADLLPADHTGVAKVMGAHQEALDDAALADLGDPLITAEVLSYIGKKWE